jgi:hypothetical protein
MTENVYYSIKHTIRVATNVVLFIDDYYYSIRYDKLYMKCKTLTECTSDDLKKNIIILRNKFISSIYNEISEYMYHFTHVYDIYNNSYYEKYSIVTYEKIINSITCDDKYFSVTSSPDYLEIVHYGPIMNIDNIKETNEELYMFLIRESLSIFENKTYEMCLESVKYNGINLEHVDKDLQTEELCIEAIKTDDRAFHYSVYKTPKIYAEYFKTNPNEILSINDDDITIEMFISAMNAINNLKYSHNYHILSTEKCLYLIRKYNLLHYLCENRYFGLKYLNDDEKTDELCIMCVKQDGHQLEYIKNKTPIICEEAIKENPYSIKYIDNPSEELCILALELSKNFVFCDVFRLIKNKTINICKCYLKQECSQSSIDGVNELFDDKDLIQKMYIECLPDNPSLIEYIEEQTEEMCIDVVKQKGMLLSYVKNKTYDICYEAVKNDGDSIIFVPHQYQSYDMCCEALKTFTDPQIIKSMNYFDEDLAIIAVKRNTYSIKYINDQYITEDLCIIAVKSSGHILELIDNKTYDICLHAIIQDIKSCEFAPLDILLQIIDLNKNMFDTYSYEYLIDMSYKLKIKCYNHIFNDCILDEYFKVIDNGLELKNVAYQSFNMCLSAVMQNGLYLQYIRSDNEWMNDYKKMDIIYKYAIKQNPFALQYINNQSYELCEKAFEQNNLTLLLIKNKSILHKLIATKNIHTYITIDSIDVLIPKIEN